MHFLEKPHFLCELSISSSCSSNLLILCHEDIKSFLIRPLNVIQGVCFGRIGWNLQVAVVLLADEGDPGEVLIPNLGVDFFDGFR